MWTKAKGNQPPRFCSYQSVDIRDSRRHKKLRFKQDRPLVFRVNFPEKKHEIAVLTLLYFDDVPPILILKYYAKERNKNNHGPTF